MPFKSNLISTKNKQLIVKLGDVNQDGKIDKADALALSISAFTHFLYDIMNSYLPYETV